jgi:hypothetical protein
MKMIVAAVLAYFAVATAWALPLANREALQGPTTFYVSPTGSDTTGDGLTPGTAWLTPRHAVFEVQRKYDFNCFQPTVKLAAGTYNGTSIEYYGPAVGCQVTGGGPLILSGDCAAGAGAVVLNGSQGINLVSMDGNAAILVVCMTLNAPGASALYATNGAIIEAGSIIFGAASTHAMADADGSVFMTGSYTIAGNAVYHGHANMGGTLVVLSGVNVTINPGLSISQQFIFASNGGKAVVPIPGVSFIGTITGQRCFASILGLVNSSGSANSLPGTIACGSNYGGQVY